MSAKIFRTNRLSKNAILFALFGTPILAAVSGATIINLGL